jgi:hypothetical protein
VPTKEIMMRKYRKRDIESRTLSARSPFAVWRAFSVRVAPCTTAEPSSPER